MTFTSNNNALGIKNYKLPSTWLFSNKYFKYYCLQHCPYLDQVTHAYPIICIKFSVGIYDLI